MFIGSSKLSLLEKFVPALFIATLILAGVMGALWMKVSMMEKGTKSTTGQDQAAVTPPPDTSGKVSDDQAKNVEKPNDKDHIKGTLKADIFLIEYSDFQCPYCKTFHPTAEQAISEYGDKIAWVYRHFPLDTIHPWARPAANASECVFSLGGESAFWKFSDYVFTSQETILSEAGLKTAATNAGVNANNFSSCYTAKKFEDVVEADYQSGLTAGVTGTPGNFIMNKKGEVWVIPGAVPYDTLKATIDEALKSN